MRNARDYTATMIDRNPMTPEQRVRAVEIVCDVAGLDPDGEPPEIQNIIIEARHLLRPPDDATQPQSEA